MRNQRLLYWGLQLAGWGLFVILNLFTVYLSEGLVKEIYLYGIFLFVAGVGITHGYRALIKNWHWTKLKAFGLIVRIFIAAPILSFCFLAIVGGLSDLLLVNTNRVLVLDSWEFWGLVLNFSILFILWSILYFSFHIIRDFQRSEIKNLELKAANTEIELKNVRNQINPHFMFNSMNSIRALIDEDPKKAKEAVTLLSGIMRSTLSFGRKNVVLFREELDLVHRYLAMEKIRFEERLNYSFEIEDGCDELIFPPFMLQTIVENSVKHGISKLTEGGQIRIEAHRINGILKIKVTNTGLLSSDDNSGIGLANTQKRLDLLFGPNASFEIFQDGQNVTVNIQIPSKLSP